MKIVIAKEAINGAKRSGRVIASFPGSSKSEFCVQISLLTDALEADRHLDFVGKCAEHKIHSEIASLDREGRDSSFAEFAAGIFTRPDVGPFKGDRTGLTEHRRFAGDPINVCVDLAGLVALSRNLQV